MLLVGSVWVGAAALASPDVMNAGGIPYKISNPPGSTANWEGTPGTYSTDFNTNVKGPVEHFDVYGEVRTRYSEVYWTRNTPINLPDELVQRFAGKVMAITGYEVDQVTHSGPQNGTTTKGDVLGGFACYPDCSETDKSVPIYNAYNHHYFGWLQGADSEMYDLPEPTSNVPNPTTTAFRDLPSAALHGYPTNIVFKENPGGEFRKSYHGYPSGYAQLLHSPTNWIVEPMQIDTHNRKYDINDDTVGFQPSFIPRQVQNNMTQLKSGLSPLIECPCSDRITRTVVNTSAIVTTNVCPHNIANAAACTAAAEGMGATVVSSITVSNASLPAGCILSPVSGGYQAAFNVDTTSSATCDQGAGYELQGPFNNSLINEGVLPPLAEYGCTGEYPLQCTWDSPDQAREECGKAEACRAFFCSTFPYPGKKVPDKLLCFGRTSTAVTVSADHAPQSWVKQSPQTAFLSASAYLGGLVNFTIAHNGTTANITMTGPSDVWFGVGFDATVMADLPYAMIVDGTGTVQERKLANHGPGDALQASAIVLSNTVSGAVRTVTIQRPVAAITPNHFAIPTSPGALNVIVAIGATSDLAYHAQRTGARIDFLPSAVPSCLCEPTSTTYLTYMNTSTSEFYTNCVDEPRSDMLRHGDGTGRELPNAACNMQTYNGGLRCCAHKNILTDLEQDSLIPNETDTYFLKWRYYFQEYAPADPTTSTPASHKSLYHWVFLIDDAVNDYEEDNAHYGTESMGKITAHLNVDTMGLENRPLNAKNVSFLVMTPHCHAPSCIREEIWNADTNEILCNVSAEYGKSEYGSLNAHFNEKDYVAIPPCIFGHQAGLQYPWTLPFNTNLTAIKYLNNTFRHLGQMAQWTGLIHYPNDAF